MAVDHLNTCDLCGNIGFPDSWPFVCWRDLPMEGLGEGVMLCADCWEYQQKMLATLSKTPTPAAAAE